MTVAKRQFDFDVELKNFEVALLKKWIQPSSSRNDDTIGSRSDIQGFSIFAMTPRHVSTVTINGHKICIPSDAETAVEMLQLFALFQYLLRKKNNFLLDQILHLIKGLQRHRRKLKVYFEQGKKTLGCSSSRRFKTRLPATSPNVTTKLPLRRQLSILAASSSISRNITTP